MKRSGITRDLHSAKYRQRIVVDKRKYSRKLKHKGSRSGQPVATVNRQRAMFDSWATHQF